MAKLNRLLTKSAYITGRQCYKLFWIYQNQRDLLPEVDEATQAVFDQGHAIGDLAKSLYPGGIEINWKAGHKAGIEQTAGLIAARKPIFEGGLQYDQTHARADILIPAARGKWDLVEVKSSTRAKEEHWEDVAFQKYVYEGAGIRIGRCSVMHVNRNYVRRDEVEADRLLTLTDVTANIKPLATEVPAEVKRQLSVMSKPKIPDVDLGPQCNGCVFHDDCWSFLPERHVFSLYYGNKKAYELMDQGILAIEDIPDGFPLAPKQRIQYDCEKSGEAHAEPQKIRAFLNKLTHPLYFLDFETFMAAIPPYDELSPYEQIPFQFSLHAVPSDEANPVHHSYISDGYVDPRLDILSELKKKLGRKGSIVAYNATFEKNVLRSCTRHFPEYKSWLDSILPRFVDLLIPFRGFHYYHPDQNGGVSLKDVLPAMTGQSYAGLDIADGQEASLRFREMAFGNVTEARRREIQKALGKYCHQDTEGMIEIIKTLRRYCS